MLGVLMYSRRAMPFIQPPRPVRLAEAAGV